MAPERWQRLKAILEEVEATPKAELGAVLDKLCEGDAELRREVEAFLTEDAADTLIPGIIGAQAVNLNQAQQRFGHYQLVRRIGQGGMGAVYEARRVDDFHRKVALKIIHQGLDSDFARARFVQERQVLAGLEHANIARLLDGGQTDEGSPYLVLEFVDGVPITQYCAPLDRAARLRLFLKVCKAVQHAHSNLVVHRDLKPANILVTAEGEPKLLDFGIAKLVEPGASTTQTGFGALTPDYASPEQVRGLQITTASDVYSLGVILYQLLTERKPYKLDAATAIEMDRAICVEPPPPPGLGDELDHILLMALRKEPERRYDGVQHFAEDIERYLGHRPVSARPDTLEYRTRKFVRRYWWQLAAVATLIVVLCAGLGFSLMAERRANRRFLQVRQLANRFLFDFHDEIAQTPGTVKVRAMMVSTALEYLNSLAADATGDAGLQWELAVAYGRVAGAQGSATSPSLGRPREATASYEKAFSLARPLADSGRLSVTQREGFALMLADAAATHTFLRERDQSLRLAREAEKRSKGLSPAVRERAFSVLAASLNATGDFVGTMSVLEEALPIARDQSQRVPSEANRMQLATILANVGLARHKVMRFEEASAALTESLQILRQLAIEHPDSPNANRLASRVLRDLGDLEGGCDKPSLGRFEVAADRYREALKPIAILTGSDKNDVNSRMETGLAYTKIACSLSAVNPKVALEAATEARQLLDGAMPGSAQFRSYPRIEAANAQREMRRFAAAETLLKEAAEVYPKPDINAQADLYVAWARLEMARGNAEGAARWFPLAIDAHEKLLQKTPTPFYAWELARVLEFRAMAIPESAQGSRAREVEIWSDQNRRFPGQPHIEESLRQAQDLVKLRLPH